jgi:MFS family permease
MQNSTKKYQIRLFLICFIGGVFAGTISTLVPSYLPTIIKNFGSTNLEQISAFINAFFIYGMFLGGIVIGYLSDIWGRKKGFQIALLSMGIFTTATVFVTDWRWLVGFRLLTGFGVGGVLLTTTILVAEVWNNQKAVVALGILSICFPVGIFSAGLITYFVSDWQQVFIIGIIPCILFVATQFLIEDTSDWRQKKVEFSQNKATLRDKNTIENLIIGSLIYGTMLIGLWAVFAWLPTWVQSIVTNSDGQQERGISMMLFAVGGLLGGVVSGWLIKIVGLRNIMLLCFGGAFVFSIILFKFTTELTLFTYLNMAVIALFFGTSQGVLNAYIPELFPTLIRSTATGICFNISRIFTATAVFFIGWLVETLHGFGNALFCFSFVFLIGFLVVFLLTKNKINGVH